MEESFGSVAGTFLNRVKRRLFCPSFTNSFIHRLDCLKPNSDPEKEPCGETTPLQSQQDNVFLLCRRLFKSLLRPVSRLSLSCVLWTGRRDDGVEEPVFVREKEEEGEGVSTPSSLVSPLHFLQTVLGRDRG